MGVPGESGGLHVPKILVADDNSNVQKTMALALADLGVEVISVNNGEAAVRKLADLIPDLVLADIFMPVRNGYEVCEWVKKDARFAHVPVVLLVGAFDPLDEREAQRVGADGILKKPFVPPEPLITMVKTLLDRSLGERLVTVSVPKAPVPAKVKVGSGAAPEAPMPPAPEMGEPSPEEFTVPAGRVTFGEGDRPVAFGQLLETPKFTNSTSGADVIEPVDDEQILTNSRDATLGEPVFWRNDPPEKEEPEAEHSEGSQDDLSVHEWGHHEDSQPQQEDPTMLRPVEPLELVRDGQDEDSASHVDSESIELDPAAQSPLTVESGKAPELAANPIEWMATAPAQHPDDAPEATLEWDEPNSGGFQPEPPSYLADHQVPARPAGGEPGPFSDASKPIEAAEPAAPIELAAEPKIRSADSPGAQNSPHPASTPPASQPPEDTARSVPMHKWTEMTDSLEMRASEIAASLAASISRPSTQVPAPAQTTTQPASQPVPVKPMEPPKPAASPNLGASINPAATPNPTAPVAPDPALVEAVVQRVLEKMRPQVVDIITKEFLRPVVQELINRETEKH
jgi:CheY-like chemotaxis protein